MLRVGTHGVAERSLNTKRTQSATRTTVLAQTRLLQSIANITDVFPAGSAETRIPHGCHRTRPSAAAEEWLHARTATNQVAQKCRIATAAKSATNRRRVLREDDLSFMRTASYI
jgi:hypothetical protein